MTRPVYSGEHGTDAARHWHVAHGSRCRVCWPTPSGLPPMPPTTASTRTRWLTTVTPADDVEEVALTDQHILIALVRHPDGSLSTRDWTSVDPAVVEQVAAMLGQPAYVTHIPASESRVLGPVVRDASIVVEQGTL